MEPNYIEQQESYIAELRTRCASAEAALATMIEQKEYFRQCWEAAEAALAERDKPCMCRACMAFATMHHRMVIAIAPAVVTPHPIEVAE